MASGSPSLAVTGTNFTAGKPRGSKSIQNLLHPVVTSDQAWAMLEEKVTQRYRTVKEAFVRWDTDCDGEISDREFRAALRGMGLDMTTKEYTKLWKRFDISGDGKISYAEFNNKVGSLIHPKSDLVLKRPETPKLKEWQRRAMARGLKKKMANIEGAFREVDSDSSGYISHQEFIQLLRKLGMAKIGHEESFQMMQKNRKPGNDTGEMTFEEFKECMMEYMRIPTDVDDMPEEYRPMPLVEAEKILGDKLFNKFSAVQKAFRMYDEDKSGELSYDELRRMLRSMNVNLADEHFIALVHKFDPNGDGSISYDEFNRQLGPIIHPDAIDTSKSFTQMMKKGHAQDGLVYDPSKKHFKEEDEESEIIGKPSNSDSSAGPSPAPGEPTAYSSSSDAEASGPPVVKPVASFAGHGSASDRGSVAGSVRPATSAAALGSPQRVRRAGSVATSQFDVGSTEDKMRRVLGRSWMHVYRDVKKGQDGSGPDASAMPSESFRDIMAEKGVPLTSKEVRALTLKYHGSGSEAINVDRLLTETFKRTGPVRPGSAMPAMSSPSRPAAAGSKPPAGPSAFVRPGTSAARPASAAMSGRAVF